MLNRHQVAVPCPDMIGRQTHQAIHSGPESLADLTFQNLEWQKEPDTIGPIPFSCVLIFDAYQITVDITSVYLHQMGLLAGQQAWPLAGQRVVSLAEAPNL